MTEPVWDHRTLGGGGYEIRRAGRPEVLLNLSTRVQQPSLLMQRVTATVALHHGGTVDTWSTPPSAEPERVLLEAIRYRDDLGQVRHMVPLRDPADCTYWVLDEDGVSFYAGGDELRARAGELAALTADEVDPGTVDSLAAAYLALGDLLDELAARKAAGDE